MPKINYKDIIEFENKQHKQMNKFLKENGIHEIDYLDFLNGRLLLFKSKIIIPGLTSFDTSQKNKDD